ncbi:hypothetical protein Tco_1560480 [Tanacetum coccineum]
MGRSTETLRLLTNEQNSFRDNLCKSGLGYNGPYVLSQAYAKIPKLYRAYELRDENEQLHVFDSEDTLEDADKSRLKMNEFKKMKKFKKLSAEQTYFPSSFISSEEFSSETKPSMASMPSANPMLELLEKNSKRARIFYTSPEELRLIDVDVKEMKDVFVSVENDLDETLKQNELLKDRLLEASLVEDVKNLVITSCVEIRNKDLHDEIERISKKSKDVSNESKTADTVCNDAFEVTQELSVQRSKVESNQCDEVKVKVNFDEIKTKNIELEHRVSSLLKENEHLKLV